MGTLRFLESFDHYTTASQKWSDVSTFGAGEGIQAAAARNGAAGVRFGANTGSPHIAKSIPGAAPSAFSMGFAVRFNSFGTLPTQIGIARVSQGGNKQLSLCMNFFTGRFHLRLGSATGTLIATGTRTLVTGVWFYVEWQAVIGHANLYKWRINGVDDASGTGDLQSTGSATVEQFSLMNFQDGVQDGPNSIDFDDVYFRDDSTFMGDIKVAALVPTADGTLGAWTPFGSANHFANVDETPPNDDTDYNLSPTVAAKDTYRMTQITDSPITVKGIQYAYRAKTSDAGSRSIKGIFRSGGSGTVYENSHVEALTNSYLFPTDVAIEETNPETAAAWTIDDINNGQFGVKVEA